MLLRDYLVTDMDMEILVRGSFVRFHDHHDHKHSLIVIA
jgi:hypothetical protein